nr:hypothetical protein CKG001_22640 [Bdellovibrio sp. CKG001]BFD63569.1 hypothetical protein BdHM001_22500 [Bdellovibrio sp. HM001]BFD66277.1 hypothetical protein HAGR004_12990 [Bdellovibrio sp. HAGR004]
METVKHVVVSGVIGTVMVSGACIGIFAATMGMCGAAVVGLWLAGG